MAIDDRDTKPGSLTVADERLKVMIRCSSTSPHADLASITLIPISCYYGRFVVQIFGGRRMSAQLALVYQKHGVYNWGPCASAF